MFHFLHKLWRYREAMTYLSPAPLYHSAPQAAVALTIRNGGTAVIMERFYPEAYLALIEKHRVTHSQLVPTMFSRLLKLPAEARSRHDLASLEIAIHAAAPCPVQVKEEMIEWWGPIIHEYYGATEGLGFTACDSAEWLGASRQRRPGAAGGPAYPGRRHEALSQGRARRDLVQDGDALRVLQRSCQDRGDALGRRLDEHGRGCRLRR